MKELAARIRAILRRTACGGKTEGSGAAPPSLGKPSTGKSTAICGNIIPPKAVFPDTQLRFRALFLDTEEYLLSKNGKPVSLTATQFEIMKKFMEHPGRVYSRMDLLNSFQDTVYEGYERTIDVHIKNIRKAIEDDPARPKYIKTVWGIGYKLAKPEEL